MGKPAAQAQEAHVEFVGPEYFSTLQIPFRSGRIWDQSEIARGATSVLVNQAFVRRYLAGENAVGHAVRVPKFGTLPPMLLVAKGISGRLRSLGSLDDSLDDGLDKPVAPAIYAPYTLVMPPFTQVLVRTQGEPLLSSTAFDSRLLPSTGSAAQEIFVTFRAGSSASRNSNVGGSFPCSLEPLQFLGCSGRCGPL